MDRAGAAFRWTETRIEARFTERRSTGDSDVISYVGDAIEFMDEDGSWIRASYECDWNHETGEIVNVRTQPQ